MPAHAAPMRCGCRKTSASSASELGYGVAVSAIDKGRWFCRGLFDRNRNQPVMVLGEAAGRIGPRGVAGDGESLTPAPAPVDFLAITGTAGLRHPIGSPKGFKSLRIAPDVVQAALAHIVE